MNEVIQSLKQIQSQTQALYEAVESIMGAFPYNESIQKKCINVMDSIDDLSLAIQHCIDFEMNGGGDT